MGRKTRIRLCNVAREFALAHPNIERPAEFISTHGVLVDGQLVTNPRSLVRKAARVTFRDEPALRGEAKLRAALLAFRVNADGRVALDLGAAAGGFTRVLLDAGATRVYAVDAGYGQLLGSLRQDGRVVNLERRNLAVLDTTLVPQAVDLITIDLSCLVHASKEA